MRYYTDEERLGVHRMDDAGSVYETYCFPLGRWVTNLDLMDTLIGELWLDEIDEEDARGIIAGRNREIHGGEGAQGAARQGR